MTEGPEPSRVDLVVVNMFRGEAEEWIERLPLPESISFPAGYQALRWNPQLRVLGLVTGVGTTAAAASVVALGMDRRFDLRKAYWLIAGIGGGNPELVSVGSVAWAEWVVDADLVHEIDAREIPATWSTGRIPLYRKLPFEEPPGESLGEVWQLNGPLVSWAYQLTKDMELPDDPVLAELRSGFPGHPNAQKPPSVVRGDTLSGQTLWHGKLMNEWASRWVKYWTRGDGTFATTAMEDSGTLLSLGRLHLAGRVDSRRVLLLRAVCNYSFQPEGMGATDSLAREEKSNYSAYRPALKSAYMVGSRVALELVSRRRNEVDRGHLGDAIPA